MSPAWEHSSDLRRCLFNGRTPVDSTGRRAQGGFVKKLISLLISLGLLALLYWKIDAARLLPVFAQCDPLWMTLSLGMVVPLTLATAWRLQQLMPRAGQLVFGEANRLILVASVLNLILPSKMGDIAKAWFMRDRGHLD